jgi:hypothetical protein
MKITALAAAALLAVSAGAQAATASATISNVYIQVFDLNPLDGITAAVTFTGAAYAASTQAQATSDNGATWSYDSHSDALGLAVPAASALAGGAWAAATVVAGDPWTLGVGPGGTANAAASGPSTQAYAWGSALSSGFILTGNTLLVISADTSGVSAAAGAGEYAQGQAEVGLYTTGSNAQSSYGISYAYVDHTPGYDYAYQSLSPHITASFVNLSGSDLTGTAYAQAYAKATGAVPEPGTVAMLLSGMLVLGLLAARRARR